jgi:uncharacterized protein (TIRG00374 family)
LKKSLIVLRLTISLGLIVVLFFIVSDRFTDILYRLSNIQYFIFVLSLLCFLLAQVLLAFRFKELLKATGVTFTLAECIRLHLVGIFFNNFLPTSVGGDVVKAYYTGRHSGKKIQSYTIVFIDRVTGLISMIFIGLFVVIFFGRFIEDKRLISGLLVISGIGLFASIFLFSKRFARSFKFLVPVLRYFKIEEKIRSVFEILSGVKGNYKVILLTFFFSIISQIFSNIALWLVAYSIFLDIGILNVFVLFPIIGIVSMLPSLNGLGIREGAIVYFLSPVVGKDGSFSVSIVWFFMLVLTSIIGGIIYATAPEFKVLKKR